MTIVWIDLVIAQRSWEISTKLGGKVRLPPLTLIRKLISINIYEKYLKEI
jgi:hypothetical protein